MYSMNQRPDLFTECWDQPAGRRGGDFVVGESFEVVQHQHRAIALRQRLEQRREVALRERGRVGVRAVGHVAQRIERDDFRARPAHFARDVFGNPCRPVILDLEWLRDNAGRALAIARTIYADRTFDDLPILADMLEDAGLDNRDLLDHLRAHTVHTCGCWALDLLLERR